MNQGWERRRTRLGRLNTERFVAGAERASVQRMTEAKVAPGNPSAVVQEHWDAQTRAVRCLSDRAVSSLIDQGRVSVRSAAQARGCTVDDVINMCAKFGVEVGI